MKMSYFDDTDTLYIELKFATVDETREVNENTLIDFDKDGQIVAITLEHASKLTDLSQLTLDGLAA
jgi:uncharacterized protein YuzE